VDERPDDVTERPSWCPFCGDPVGSFFGRFADHGAVWCERCSDWFRVERVTEPAGPIADGGAEYAGAASVVIDERSTTNRSAGRRRGEESEE
jgi:hypothetical protein